MSAGPLAGPQHAAAFAASLNASRQARKAAQAMDDAALDAVLAVSDLSRPVKLASRQRAGAARVVGGSKSAHAATPGAKPSSLGRPEGMLQRRKMLQHLQTHGPSRPIFSPRSGAKDPPTLPRTAWMRAGATPTPSTPRQPSRPQAARTRSTAPVEPEFPDVTKAPLVAPPQPSTPDTPLRALPRQRGSKRPRTSSTSRGRASTARGHRNPRSPMSQRASGQRQRPMQRSRAAKAPRRRRDTLPLSPAALIHVRSDGSGGEGGGTDDSWLHRRVAPSPTSPSSCSSVEEVECAPVQVARSRRPRLALTAVSHTVVDLTQDDSGSE